MAMSLADLPNALVQLFDPTALFDAHTRLYALQVAGLDAGSLLVESFSGIDALSALPVLELHCLSTDAGLDLGDLLGRQVALQISLSDGSRVQRTGYIATADDEAGDGGLARYKFSVVPGLWYAHRNQQSRVFQQRSPLEIVQSVLDAYRPWVVWQLTPDAEAAALATTPLNYCVQYRETDYAFVRRILADAGLGFVIEEIDAEASGDLGDAALHQLRIFADASQLPEDRSAQHSLGGKGIRFHRAGSTEEQDCITQLSKQVHALAPGLTATLAWHDTGRHAVAASSSGSGLEQFLPLATDRFADQAQAQARVELVDALLACDRERLFALGNVRSLRAGTRFTLSQYEPLSWQTATADAPQYLSCAQRFVGINNLPKSAADTVAALLGQNPLRQAAATLSSSLGQAVATLGRTPSQPAAHKPQHSFRHTLQRLGLLDESQQATWSGFDTDFAQLAERAQSHGYAHASRLQRRELPWHAPLLAKPAVPGPLSAIVVGDEAVHTDRLGRVKVRFHWQQGQQPDDSDTCWLRVVQRAAGPTRGMQFTPRPGHAVWVGFLNGDIDRPLVIGSQYHGVGEGDASYSPAKTTLDSEASFTPPDTSVFGQAKDRSPAAQGNLHSGHSPTWHGAAAGEQAHRHAGALLGIRSQSLDGQGYNQLLFDDSDNQLAIQLATTQADTQLNLGHLIHRADNYRGSFRGEGAELRTDAYGALRAGRGWVFTSYAIRHTNQMHEPAGELAGPIALLKQAQQLSQALSQTTATHTGVKAASQTGPAQAGKSALDPSRSPLPGFLHAVQGQVNAQDPGQALSDAGQKQIQAKANTAQTPGTVPAVTDPLLLLAARGGIVAASQDAFFLTGETQNWLAGGHLNLLTGNQLRLDANQAISFTGGLAEGDKDQGQGLSAITGEGDLLIQAHAGTMNLAAKGKLTLESAKADTTLAAAKTIVIQTAGGASITLDGGITVACPGTITVKASKKSFVGAAKIDAVLPRFAASELKRRRRIDFSG